MSLKVEVVLPDHWWQRVRYRLLEPVSIAGEEVPAGFVSDGASVPRILWFLFPPVDRYLAAAFLHDFKLERGDGWQSSNRAFRLALSELDIVCPRRLAMAAATSVWGLVKVRLFDDVP